MKSIFGVSNELSFLKEKDDDEIVHILKQLGVNAVFGCHDNPELTTTIQQAGIRVYAELGLFTDPKIWEEHPEARSITAGGRPIDKHKWYGGLCPNQPWLRKEKLDLVRKHVEEDGVDGVWLDYIRYACYWEAKDPFIQQSCFCPVCLGLFRKETGLSFSVARKNAAIAAQWILAKHKNAWTQFKCKQINSFVEESRNILKKANPNAVLGLFGVPWLKSDYNNAIEEIIAQDYKALGAWVDIFSPMCYHDMCGRDAKWISTVSTEISRISGKPCVPIVQVAEISPEEFARALAAAVEPPSQGVIAFNLRHLKNEAKLEHFRNCRVE